MRFIPSTEGPQVADRKPTLISVAGKPSPSDGTPNVIRSGVPSPLYITIARILEGVYDPFGRLVLSTAAQAVAEAFVLDGVKPDGTKVYRLAASTMPSGQPSA